MLINILLVSVGAIFGVLARLLLSNWMKTKWPMQFPLATLCINISGSFLLGLLFASGLNSHFQLLIGTGFMGSYTTFSTFKLENIELHLKKKYRIFWSYMGASYILGIGFAALGLWIGNTYL